MSSYAEWLPTSFSNSLNLKYSGRIRIPTVSRNSKQCKSRQLAPVENWKDILRRSREATLHPLSTALSPPKFLFLWSISACALTAAHILRGETNRRLSLAPLMYDSLVTREQIARCAVDPPPLHRLSGTPERETRGLSSATKTSLNISDVGYQRVSINCKSREGRGFRKRPQVFGERARRNGECIAGPWN